MTRIVGRVVKQRFRYRFGILTEDNQLQINYLNQKWYALFSKIFITTSM